MTQKVDSKRAFTKLPPVMSLSPHLVNKIWGGGKLRLLKGMVPSKEKLGETWEISCLREGPSTYGDGPLCDLIESTKLPYLVKFLDTSDNLSVQVHPGDEYARRVENTKGKTECWLILDCEKDAGIYLGFKKGVKKDDLVDFLKEKKEIDQLLNFIPVKKGDFFYVPAGTVHAIGKGITLAEIQQSSGVTYRVWDWNRVDDSGLSRELHIDKSLDVLEFDEDKNTLEYFKYKTMDENKSQKLISHSDFTVHYLRRESFKSILADTNKYIGVVVLKGDVTINGLKLKSYTAGLITDLESINEIDVKDADYLIIS